MSRSLHVAAVRPGERDGVDYNFMSARALRGDDRGTRRVSRVGGRLRQPLRHRRRRTPRRGSRGRRPGAGHRRAGRADRCAGGAAPSTSASSCCRRRSRCSKQRLRGRSKDTEEAIQRRLATAREEVRGVSGVRLRGRQRRARTRASSGCAPSSLAERSRLRGDAGRRRGAIAEELRGSAGQHPSVNSSSCRAAAACATLTPLRTDVEAGTASPESAKLGKSEARMYVPRSPSA